MRTRDASRLDLPDGIAEWTIGDEVTHLREWGTDRIHVLPRANEATIGTADSCELQLIDPFGRASRRHAQLYRVYSQWAVRDLTNGTRIDGERRIAFLLAPGVEVSIGGITLIAENPALVALWRFLARLIGWSENLRGVVDRSLRTVRMAAQRFRPLLICGEGDLVPIAQDLHRRTFGEARPFVLWDPQRSTFAASVRSAESRQEGGSALDAAAGGTLCVRARRLPPEFREVVLALCHPNACAQLVVCAADDGDPRKLLADPIIIPPLSARASELPRIIDEYAADAIRNLPADQSAFTSADHDWVIERSASTLPEIEKGTRRLVAIRHARSITRAAALLGMSHVALSQWIGRRSAEHEERSL